MRSENGQLLMIPQQALAQMQAQAHAQAQPQTTMAPRPATPTSAPPVQISTVQVSARARPASVPVCRCPGPALLPVMSPCLSSHFCMLETAGADLLGLFLHQVET